MLNYSVIEIFTSEAARSGNKPVADAVIDHLRNLKIAARCIVTRGIAGCYENGEVATGRLEILSLNMPLRISIVVPAAQTERVTAALDEIVGDGIVAVQPLNVVRHRARTAFFPPQIMVRDAMTAQPESVAPDTPLDVVTRLLLSSVFTGLPVVDGRHRPIGIITQGDLIRKGGLALRLGLLAESDNERREAVLVQMAGRSAAEVMTTPVVTIGQDRPLTEAVEQMLAEGVKRIPVTGDHGRLTGMLSRLDIFRTVMREAPDWQTFQAQRIEVTHLKRVEDILRRDTHTVTPETSIAEVARIIDTDDIQRVVVVNADGRLLGLISDRDLLRFFKPRPEGIWRLLAKVKHPFQPQDCPQDPSRCLAETKAGSVMATDLITVNDQTLIEEAIALMIDKGLKRLPVVDDAGRFKGMISRDSLLRTGFGKTVKQDARHAAL